MFDEETGLWKAPQAAASPRKSRGGVRGWWESNTKWARIGVVGLIVLVPVGLVALGSLPNPDDGSSGGGRPGSPAVYLRMDSETDCAVLQQEFDQASYNHDHIASNKDASLAYMEYADNRLQELGCYG